MRNVELGFRRKISSPGPSINEDHGNRIVRELKDGGYRPGRGLARERVRGQSRAHGMPAASIPRLRDQAPMR